MTPAKKKNRVGLPRGPPFGNSQDYGDETDYLLTVDGGFAGEARLVDPVDSGY
jgi:hypothetical protein